MQINLGEKIKQLRKRDGRKQEDLAKVLGVTAQAVSRWEANGGYPDMNMIPAIANYFHISIDELFGYNNDRNKKIKRYCDKAQKMLNVGQDMSECISLLRTALEEFPEEKDLKVKLAFALNRQGWNHKGETPNVFWEESAKLYEELVEAEPTSIIPLLSIYSELGEKDRAVKKAEKQPGIDVCKEVLLGSLFGFENEDKYHGEAVLSLLHHLRATIEVAIAQNDELAKSRDGIDILLSERKLFEKILGEDCLGYHSEFCFIDMQLAKIFGRLNEYNSAMEYFDSAFVQYTRYYEKFGKGFKEYKELPDDSFFDTQILHAVKKATGGVHIVETEFLRYTVSTLPEEVQEKIKGNPKYVTLFT